MYLVVPCRYPGEDPGKFQAQIVAGHVARLGDEHESTFSPEQYTFLQDKSSLQYLYYRWLVFCYRNDVDTNRLSEIEEYYAQQYLRRATPGYLDLDAQDKQHLSALLQQNNASKESIRYLRKWCLDRSHSIAAIAFILYTHLVQVMQAPGDPACFDKIKNTLYALNDILFNWKLALWKGPYTSVLSLEEESRSVDIISPLFNYLPTIVFYSLGMSQLPEQRQKIIKLVEIWQTKDFLGMQQIKELQDAISSSLPPRAPDYPTLYPVTVSAQDLAQFRKPIDNVGPVISPPLLHQSGGFYPPSYISGDIATSHFSGQATYAPSPLPSSEHIMFSAADHGYANPALTAPVAIVDPLIIPVGALANLVKGYLRCGGEPFTTIDPLHSQISVNPHVEPGRLNVRLLDFYRKVETSLPPPPPPPPSGHYTPSY